MNDLSDLFEEDTLSVVNLIISHLKCGIIVARSNPEEFVLWNDEAIKLVGLGRASIPPEEWSAYYGVYEENGELCKPENLPLVKAMRGEEDKNHILFMQNASHPKGNWILCDAMPIKKNDQVIGGLVVIQDISEKQAILIELKALKERVRSLYKNFDLNN